jgi:HAD superfamily hydrolase (TIGR01509 family)
MAPIKNIIFDLGGVLINIDYNRTKKAFIDLGFTHFDEMYNQYTADELFARLETGKINDDDFYKSLLAKADKHLNTGQLTQAWNAMLLDFRKDSLQHLPILAKQYRLYLLSNTNAIHKQAFDGLFRKDIGDFSFDDYFIKAWYSHKIGLRKPNAAIFAFVLQDAGIKAEETLFIDDSYNNIEAALNMGFQTRLLLNGEKIECLGL